MFRHASWRPKCSRAIGYWRLASLAERLRAGIKCPVLAALADELMADDILRGLGSAGPGFMNHKPRELRFLINSMIAL